MHREQINYSVARLPPILVTERSVMMPVQRSHKDAFRGWLLCVTAIGLGCSMACFTCDSVSRNLIKSLPAVLGCWQLRLHPHTSMRIHTHTHTYTLLNSTYIQVYSTPLHTHYRRILSRVCLLPANETVFPLVCGCFLMQ